jgi:hypothetical protein
MDEGMLFDPMVLRMNGILCWFAIENYGPIECLRNRQTTVIAE